MELGTTKFECLRGFDVNSQFERGGLHDRKVRRQSIHQHRALAYQSLPTSVQQHSGLLFSRLGRHEAHCRPHNRLADRFRIRSVVLVPLDVGLHVCAGISRTSWPSTRSSRAQ